MIAREEWDFLERLLDMSITMDIFKNATNKDKQEFN